MHVFQIYMFQNYENLQFFKSTAFLNFRIFHIKNSQFQTAKQIRRLHFLYMWLLYFQKQNNQVFQLKNNKINIDGFQVTSIFHNPFCSFKITANQFQLFKIRKLKLSMLHNFKLFKNYKISTFQF